MHKGVSQSLSFNMSNSRNSALRSNREFLPGNIINNIFGVGELVPPFNKPLPSSNIAFLYIQSFQDLGDFVFFNKMKYRRKLIIMCISLIKTYKIPKGVNQRSWKNINNWAKLRPPSGEPKRELRTKIFIKLTNQEWVIVLSWCSINLNQAWMQS